MEAETISNGFLYAQFIGFVVSLLACALFSFLETEKSPTSAEVEMDIEADTKNVFDAISKGTTDGLQLALNVGAMLIAFISLLALVNAGLGYLYPGFSLATIFSYLFAPFGYLLGFTGQDALKAGELLGTKVTINEVIAYSEMIEMNLSPRAVSILTYTLCGFSNFS